MLPPEGEEGGFARDATITEDCPGDFFFLRLVTLVIGNLSQQPHLSELERHGRYWVYWPVGRN